MNAATRTLCVTATTALCACTATAVVGEPPAEDDWALFEWTPSSTAKEAAWAPDRELVVGGWGGDYPYTTARAWWSPQHDDGGTVELCCRSTVAAFATDPSGRVLAVVDEPDAGFVSVWDAGSGARLHRTPGQRPQSLSASGDLVVAAMLDPIDRPPCAHGRRPRSPAGASRARSRPAWPSPQPPATRSCGA